MHHAVENSRYHSARCRKLHSEFALVRTMSSPGVSLDAHCHYQIRLVRMQAGLDVYHLAIRATISYDFPQTRGTAQDLLLESGQDAMVAWSGRSSSRDILFVGLEIGGP